MPADEAAALVVKLEARVDRLAKDLAKAGVIAGKAVKDIEDKFAKANPSISLRAMEGALRGALSGAAVTGLAKAVLDANANVAALGETARKAGIDVENLQKLAFAGRQSGLKDEQFTSGLEKFSDLYKDLLDKESKLGQLFEANGVKYKDRNNYAISFNQALGETAELFSRAASEGEKIKLAEALGLPRDFIPLLERGADKIGELGKEAEASGQVIDREIVQRAADFDKAWSGAWSSFAVNAKSALSQIATGIADAIGKAAELNRISASRGTADAAAANRSAAIQRQADFVAENALKRNPDLARRRDQAVTETLFREMDANNSGISPMAIPPPPPRPEGLAGPDTTNPFGRKRGGGGEETTDADRAQSKLERYIETLMRQEAVEKAIADTIGQSKAAQQAAIEVARAQVDLSKLDEETRKRITEQLVAQVTSLERQREATHKLREAQQSYNQLLEFAGNSAIDAIDRLIVGGEKFSDVMADVARNLAKMFLQSAFLGQGPLASLFGTAGSNGPGGKLGEIYNFGRRVA